MMIGFTLACYGVATGDIYRVPTNLEICKFENSHSENPPLKNISDEYCTGSPNKCELPK